MMVCSKSARILLFSLACLAGLISSGRADVTELDGYRLDDYRAETPKTLHGATVIGAQELRRLMLQDAVVAIDVLPQPQRPPELPATTYWHSPARHDIPGSVWLANVGYGALSDEMNQYFQDALDNISLGDKARKLAFYCETQCWMSWNAAKRALSYGYRSVYWFPGGVQEWRAAGYPTMLNAAIPLK
jgi:PQQ-dependent catabolism-associated CXXCW motif protein